MIISSNPAYSSYTYQASSNGASTGGGTGNVSTNDTSYQYAYNSINDCMTTGMFTYMNSQLGATGPFSAYAPNTGNPDSYPVQSENSLLSLMMGWQSPSASPIDSSLIGAYDQMNAGDSGLTSGMASYLSGSLGQSLPGSSLAASSLYSTSLYQQAYMQSSLFLQNYNALGQQMNMAI